MKLVFLIAALLFNSQAHASSCDGGTALLLGDSHSDTQFGTELYRAIDAIPNLVHLFSTCSSRPDHWATPIGYRGNATNLGCGYRTIAPSFGQLEQQLHEQYPAKSRARNLMDKFAPCTVIIEQGDNQLEDAESEIRGQNLALLTQIFSNRETAPARCFWVGPPWGQEKYGSRGKHIIKDDAHLMHVIESSKKSFAEAQAKLGIECEFVDSTTLASRKALEEIAGEGGNFTDSMGVHLVPKADTYWGQVVGAEIVRRLKSIP